MEEKLSGAATPAGPALSRRALLAAAIATPLTGVIARYGNAQGAPTIRIGVLADMSGAYRDTGGPTSLACAQQAVEDFRPAERGINVEILAADHQQKADVGAALARRWYDLDDVDVIVEVNNSAVALAVGNVAHDKNKIHLNTGAVSSDLTGRHCNPSLLHWTSDSWMCANAIAPHLVRDGGKDWYFIAPDYAFGHSLQRDTARMVEQAGGKVLGRTFYPFPSTTDYSSYLLQAVRSGAKVLGFANGAGDLQNSLKQAHEFGLHQRGIRITSLVTFITDIHSVGLEITQDLVLTESFYWDLNDRTRAFTRRVLPKTPRNYPNQEHAATYSGVLHYLKAVAEIGPAKAKASGQDTIAAMKRLPTDDDCFGAGRLREDGRKINATHLFSVKKPSESKGAWDYYKLISTIPAEEAFRPVAEGGCPFIQR
ncbi:ABC transporter permease [Pseudoroseomonas rhizosphaerae]|uniref:ABC transporter permease n=1 Tax=Teichococcus rhizosphaerae TaxID=1335062 RepID=A0A2C7ADG8_9PROT|nr:ABC transporter substrate-binding protein [Pseudoroseomonas rhizosphaerae]PHK95485.1 ABC transporter permease [Pseudoroseomonas rhizosphaerae]